MERVQKQSGEITSQQRTAQGKFAVESNGGEFVNRVNNSPAMAAQRKKLGSLFGNAIQRVDEEKSLQGKSADTQMKHELGEEEFLPGKFGMQQYKRADGKRLPRAVEAIQFYSLLPFPRVAQFMTEEKLVNTKSYGTAYYQYDHDSKGNIDDFSSNLATRTPVGPDPVDSTSWVDLESVSGAGEGTMLSGKEVAIIGASRSQHFSMADNLNDSGPSDRKGSYTWHHLTPKYEMVLVDMAVHGAFGHKGGYSLWA